MPSTFFCRTRLTGVSVDLLLPVHNLLLSFKCFMMCSHYVLWQCFWTAGTRTGTGTWHQLYRAATDSPGICNFSFSKQFSWTNVSVNVSKDSDPDAGPEETTICYKISLVHWLITNLNVILYLSTCHTVYISVLIFFTIMPQLIINIYVSLMYELKLERYLRVNLLGPWPRLVKEGFTGPRSHKGWETLAYGIRVIYINNNIYYFTYICNEALHKKNFFLGRNLYLHLVVPVFELLKFQNYCNTNLINGTPIKVLP